MFVHWLQWLIAHPLSVSKPADHQFEEMVKHPELFKVDWRVALCSCWLEFFGLLKCICTPPGLPRNCHRRARSGNRRAGPGRPLTLGLDLDPRRL